MQAQQRSSKEAQDLKYSNDIKGLKNNNYLINHLSSFAEYDVIYLGWTNAKGRGDRIDAERARNGNLIFRL